MHQLPYPQKGDTIAVVTPAGNVRKEEVLPAINWLEDLGYKILPGRNLYDRWHQFGGTDADRAADLQAALDNRDISAIFFTRGGYGTVRLLESLQWEAFLSSPKWLMGFSDITLLHNLCNTMGVPSIHSVMLRGAMQTTSEPSAGLSALVDLWNGKQLKYTIEPQQLNRPGVAEGVLVGGNLALIYSMLGTPNDLDTRGKILFIEDVGEYLYNIDRMMHSLRMAGKLTDLKGLVVGQFSALKDNDDPFGMDYSTIIRNAVSGTNFPVSFGIPAGHDYPNMPLVFGHPWRLEVGSQQTQLAKL